VRLAGFFTIGIVLASPFTVQSQLPDYHVRVFNESDGIKNYVIRAIVKDHNDFLWIANFDRVQKFDGKHVTNFIIDDPRYIFCDSKNRVWVTNHNQIYKYENDVQGFLPAHVEKGSKDLLGAVFELEDGRIFLQTSSGFDILSESERQFQLFPLGISNLFPIKVDQFDFYHRTFFFAQLIQYSHWILLAGNERVCPRSMFINFTR